MPTWKTLYRYDGTALPPVILNANPFLVTALPSTWVLRWDQINAHQHALCGIALLLDDNDARSSLAGNLLVSSALALRIRWKARLSCDTPPGACNQFMGLGTDQNIDWATTPGTVCEVRTTSLNPGYTVYFALKGPGGTIAKPVTHAPLNPTDFFTYEIVVNRQVATLSIDGTLVQAITLAEFPGLGDLLDNPWCNYAWQTEATGTGSGRMYLEYVESWYQSESLPGVASRQELITPADIRTTWDNQESLGRFTLLDSGTLETDEGLETAVYLSLFTDAKADNDDKIPANSTWRRGWWADGAGINPGSDRFGSKLWLLSRESTIQSALIRAEQYASEALAWLKTDRVASDVKVTAEALGRTPGGSYVLAIKVEITRTNMVLLSKDYSLAWGGIYAG